MPACQLLGQCLGKDVDPLPARGACRGLARLPIGRGLLQGLPVCAGIAAVGLVIVVVAVRFVALTAVLAVIGGRLSGGVRICRVIRLVRVIRVIWRRLPGRRS